MELLIGTHNRGKFAEFAEALVPLHIQLKGGFDFADIPPAPEEAHTYEENARSKALHYHQATGLPTLADDSGLEVDALEGELGVRSARFGGEGLTDGDRCRRLLEAMKDVPDEKRHARYVAVVALAAKGKIVGTYRGEAQGVLLREPRGEHGFGYDPLFYSTQLHLTFAQLLPAVKRQVSHRGLALAMASTAIRREMDLLR